MPLSAGDKLGHYEVLSLLGQGGMGEVYRVRDTKLKRDVALKVLPATYLRDPERMARFQREAQVLASLDHPNIGPIYGMADSEDSFGLVLALVEGPTLADRIKEGPLALDETVAIGKQIVEALEFAHDRGVIHRDLKPANIKITPEGVVKVLDFGLAKVLEDEPPKSSLANSPTMTMGHTRAGMILGTAAYMSPEQAVGRPVDRRSDIFSFGAVLYEMLAGKRAFVGSTTPDVLEAVVKNEPDWSALPADTSDTIQRLLRRCLAKDRRQRLQAIGEARIVLENPGGTDRSRQATSPPHKKLPWVVAAIFLLGFGVVSFLHFRKQPPKFEVTRFAVLAPDKTSFTPAAPAISPDGRTLAFAAIDGEGRSQIWLRPMNSSEAHALPGTEGASAPVFWSPDGRSLAFAGRSLARLMSIDVVGGPAQTLCPATAGVPVGAWSPAGIIIFQANDGLMEVPAGGGTCAPVTKLDSKRGELRHTGPSFLPDGRHFLYLRVASKEEDSGVYVGSLDSKPEEQSSKLIAKGASPATYVPSADPAHGYLMFLRQGALMAQPFNADSLSLAGDAVPIVARVGTNGDLFTASENGTLVYRSGGSSGSRQLTWFDRSGRSPGSLGAPGAYTTLSVSPDGKRVAFGLADNAQNNTDIWVHDLAQGTTNRFTFDPAVDDMPVWSPDGTRIVWSSQREGGADLYQRASNLAGDETALMKSPEPKFPQDWSSDGRFLIYSVNRGDRGGTNLDLWLLPLQGEQKATQFLGTPFTESQGRFSPDSRYVAYVSNESGKNEVYVRSFSSDGKAGGQQMISRGGGSQPLWRRDGKELFYISADSKVMAVPLSTTPTFRRVGTPVALFTAPIYGGGRNINTHRWAAMPDGQKFIINSVLTEAPSEPITVIMNWTELLKK
jgi:serine/threonine protein kinase